MEQERRCVMCWHPAPPDAWRRSIPDGCHGPFASLEAADEWRLAKLIEAGEIESIGRQYAIARLGEMVFERGDVLEWWEMDADKREPRIQCHAVPYYEHMEAATA